MDLPKISFRSIEEAEDVQSLADASGSSALKGISHSNYQSDHMVSLGLPQMESQECICHYLVSVKLIKSDDWLKVGRFGRVWHSIMKLNC